MDIGENLKRARETRNLTQTAIAEEVGVAQSMISQIERGTKALSVPLAVAIADALGCSVSELCEPDGGKKEKGGARVWKQT